MGQRIEHGMESIREIISGKNIFLVKDNSFDFLEIRAFFDAFPYVDFSEFTPNPLYEQVVDAVDIFNKNNCDMIVAVGGGSTIDVAKCIKLYCRMDPSINYLKQEMFDSGIPLVAIPTTAGTGSESTHFAVIYYSGVKQSISHYSIIPDIAVLEPAVLKTLPVYQKKCTMLDALCQSIESWWSVNSSDESKNFSRKAIELIRDYWREYLEENSFESFRRILVAANYSGRAINITSTTAAHAMSYKLTSIYQLPHGHAVAICLPVVWEYMLYHTDKCIDPRGTRYLSRALDELPVDLLWFAKLLMELDIHNPISQQRQTDLNELSKSVNPERLQNNPVELDIETLRIMYEVIVK